MLEILNISHTILLFLVNYIGINNVKISTFIHLEKEVEQLTTRESVLYLSILFSVPPSILSIAGDLDLEQGHDLYLTCKVEGVPRPSILWSVRGKTIIPTSDGRVSFPQFNSLLIQYARGEDSGEYKCTAENDAGVAKQAAQVFVKGE